MKKQVSTALLDLMQKHPHKLTFEFNRGSFLVTIEHKEAQYRSVLLLKALQTVLSILEVERGQRAARADEDSQMTSQQCRLQSLIVSLRKYTLEPSVAKINNCEGSCSFPLSTTSNNHVVLLNSHIQSGHPVNRSPCCVPVEYDDLCVIELESKATVTSFKPKVVATKCECRWQPLCVLIYCNAQVKFHRPAFIFACKYPTVVFYFSRCKTDVNALQVHVQACNIRC